MTNRLCIDLGTKIGYAAILAAETAAPSVFSGMQEFKNTRFSGGGMRFLRFRGWLKDLHAATPIDSVHYEEVRRHAGTDAAHVYGGFLAALTSWCEEEGIPYEGVPVGTIKKSATGKKGASKDLMIEAMRMLGYDPVDDNEADALAIARYVLKNFR